MSGGLFSLLQEPAVVALQVPFLGLPALGTHSCWCPQEVTRRVGSPTHPHPSLGLLPAEPGRLHLWPKAQPETTVARARAQGCLGKEDVAGSSPKLSP